MNRKMHHLVQGARLDNGEQIEGYYIPLTGTRACITDEYPKTIMRSGMRAFAEREFFSGQMSLNVYEVDPDTIKPVAVPAVIKKIDYSYNKDGSGIREERFCPNCDIDIRGMSQFGFCKYCGQAISSEKGKT